MSDSKPSAAGPATHRPTGPAGTFGDLVSDCRTITLAVQTLHAAVHHASHSISSTQTEYPAVADIYRDAVARGSGIRSRLASARPDSELGQVAWQVGVMMQQASDAFGQFLTLHIQSGSPPSKAWGAVLQ